MWRTAAAIVATSGLVVVSGCGGGGDPSRPELRVQAADLEHALALAPSMDGRMRDVECRNGAASGLGNPWRCTAVRGRTSLTFGVTVEPDGGFRTGTVERNPEPAGSPRNTLTQADGTVVQVGAFNSGEASFGCCVPVAER